MQSDNSENIMFNIPDEEFYIGKEIEIVEDLYHYDFPRIFTFNDPMYRKINLMIWHDEIVDLKHPVGDFLYNPPIDIFFIIDLDDQNLNDFKNNKITFKNIILNSSPLGRCSVDQFNTFIKYSRISPSCLADIDLPNCFLYPKIDEEVNYLGNRDC